MGKKIDIAMIAGLTEQTELKVTNLSVKKDEKTKISATISLESLAIIRNYCYTEVINGGDKRFISEALDEIILSYGRAHELQTAPERFLRKKERKTKSKL